MESPSRNPLLLTHDNEELSDSEAGDNNPENRSGSQQEIKESFRRSSSMPVDRFNFAYIAFYILGMATLLPWNFFMTAEEYWQYKFRNLTSNNTDILTPRQIQFQPDLAMCSAIPTTLFLILNAFYSHKVSLKLRMVGSIVIILLLFSVTTAFVKVDTDGFQNPFFYFTLLIVFIVNIFSAILSGGLFGIAGMFSSEYISAVMSGQALGGVFTALAEVISITFTTAPTVSAFIYFMVGTGMLVLSLFLYLFVSKTLFFKFHVNQSHVKANHFSVNTDTSPLSSPAVTATTLATINRNYLQPNWRKIYDKIWVHGFSVWLVFVTTLSVYPAITVLITSVNRGHHHAWNDIYFLPVLNYLLFNAGDYIGRILSGWIKRPKNKPKLVAFLTVLRVGFVPAFLLCNITQKHPLPVLIYSDEVFILLMTFFAISNGYIANISLIYAPTVVEEHEKEMTSSMMAAFMGIGLTFGSAISFVLIQFVS
ncbi:CLUMA_CG007156, isoform A [Clunio marinus]|uniref:CLUMA_CG007156, isoform A n=1 Tax=Clunio marinus TaxID=568069 RepID=A0A1J1I1J2_9DIPT|nr:CLUMA_CG007156, isoform A [Clunio marinus]